MVPWHQGWAAQCEVRCAKCEVRGFWACEVRCASAKISSHFSRTLIDLRQRRETTQKLFPSSQAHQKAKKPSKGRKRANKDPIKRVVCHVITFLLGFWTAQPKAQPKPMSHDPSSILLQSFHLNFHKKHGIRATQKNFRIHTA